MKSQRNGFTLIELIMVMATIAVLFSMITPMFRNIRDKGKILVCLNNVRNITEGFMVYASENPAGRLPLCGWYCEDGFHGKRRGNHGVGRPWMDVIAPYLNDDKNMFVCPADENPDNYDFHCHSRSGGYNNDGWYIYPMDDRTAFTECSYSANEDVIGIDNRYNTYNASGSETASYGGRIGGDLTKMGRSPSSTVLLCDGHHIYINSQKIRDMQDAESVSADYTMDRAVFNHIDGISVGFCDGHGEWVKKGRFSSLNIDPNYYGK